jgi:hypothetical protein
MVRINNVEVDVDITSIVTNDTLDETLASGNIVIPFSSQSTPYARLSEVDIDDLLFLVSEDNVTQIRKGLTPLYKHEISLIEPTKLLQKRVIPNITVTQPQGDIADYAFSVHNIANTVAVNSTQQTLSLVETSASKNLTVINGLQLKNTSAYEIYISMIVENRQLASIGTPRPDLIFEVQLLIGGVIQTTKTYDIKSPSGVPNTNVVTLNTAFPFFYTPATINQNVSIRVRTTEIENDTAHIVDFNVTIAQALNIDNKIYLDTVVDKILSFHPTFTLAEATRVKLARTVSPEFTFQNYTLYDALKEVANYVSGIVYLGEDDFTTVYFYYYDQVLEQVLDYADESITETLADFTDGFEINAPNVIREDSDLYAILEPTSNAFKTIRANNDERATPIIDTQAALRLEHPIYRLIKVEVKGLAFEMRDASNNVVNRPAFEMYDITPYVIENTRYNTFDTLVNPNGRGTFKNKSNTITYTQGSDLITNLGFTGSVQLGWNAQIPPNYAIHEAILNAAQLKYPALSFTNDYRVTGSLHNLQFRLKYIPYSDVRLTMYKRKGDNVMYFNEQAPLNDMELLGRLAQESVERIGNRLHRYEGLTFSDRLLLGSKQGDTNEVLVNYTISRTPTINKFVAEYAVGYANISNYVGVKSAYRQYEIPTTTLVNRRDKKTNFYKLKAYPTIQTGYVEPASLTTDVIESIFSNFTNTASSGFRPTYAKLTFDGKAVESIVDSYRMGKTIGLAVDMYDNYSAGIKKVDKSFVSNNTIITNKTQEDARYTNDLGRATQVRIQYNYATFANSPDNYPDNNFPILNPMFDYTYTVNKDTRERYGFVWELAFFGDNIILFDGFVKYNRLASELTANKVEYRLLKGDYIPQRSFDINQTELISGSLTNVTTHPKLLAVPNGAGSYSGLVLTLNQEPILAIISNDYSLGVNVTRYIYLEEL